MFAVYVGCLLFMFLTRKVRVCLLLPGASDWYELVEDDVPTLALCGKDVKSVFGMGGDKVSTYVPCNLDEVLRTCCE